MLFATLLGALLSIGSVNYNQRVVVTVIGLKNTQGNCNACLFSNADAFPGEAAEAVACKKGAISGSNAEVIFENVPAGTFAVSVFHDENDDGELNTNFLGIPQEGYGASGNVLPKMSAPSFEDNSFTVSDNDIALEIKLRY
uniref:DUF2141 domain-containing protein n=1 Tax=Roseihalotalea indica TaxID=2867963 RepID=A0AA49GJL4_9BACT|nr:DUF2141 domain-containing protein [Tunicatimonas sp. TK19036]